MTELLFAHEQMRPVQEELIRTLQKALEEKKHCLIHAPTGLGKTAAALAPSLALAKQKNLTVLFLTSRHTQHEIVLETIKKIKQKHQESFEAVSIIGKKWMCAQENTTMMQSNDFAEFCKALRENEQCSFYTHTRTKKGEKTPQAQQSISQLKVLSPHSAEHILKTGKQEELCPYELSLLMAEDARVIVTDYYYLFHEKILEGFLQKINKRLEDCILIVDEGHNLPTRARELMTSRLTTLMIKRAIKEAKKYHLESILSLLSELQNILMLLAHPIKEEGEKLVKKETFVKEVNAKIDYEQCIEDLYSFADEVREQQKTSSLGSIALFLENWLGPDEGYSRILKVTKDNLILSHRCLDPSLITRPVFEQSYASIVMSGTLIPLEMYQELLGLETATIKSFE